MERVTAVLHADIEELPTDKFDLFTSTREKQSVL